MLLNLPTFQFVLPLTNRRSPKTTLLIMISATEESLVEDLQVKKEIDSAKMAEELYRAAQYIFTTAPKQLRATKSQLKKHVSYEPVPDDVYLLELSLFDEDCRFEQHVNALDRYDAFTDLIRTTAKVKLSERLRMEVCSCLDLYVR